MLTREQIEAWLAEASANNWGAPLSTDDQATVLHLALLGLDAGRDAKTCAWRVDDDGLWHTQCGGIRCLDSGTPIENEMRWCPGCGGALREEASDGDV